MDAVTQVQILDKAVCISHNANTLGKKYESNNPLIWVNSLGMATSLGEEFKPVKLHLNN